VRPVVLLYSWGWCKCWVRHMALLLCVTAAAIEDWMARCAGGARLHSYKLQVLQHPRLIPACVNQERGLMSRDSRHSNVVTKPSTICTVMCAALR
jgi:hypothetical protein